MICDSDGKAAPMTPKTTLMRQEIEEIPVAVERLLSNGGDALSQGESKWKEGSQSATGDSA